MGEYDKRIMINGTEHRANTSFNQLSDNINVIMGNSGDGKTFSLLKNLLHAEKHFCFISLEETYCDCRAKIESINETCHSNFDNYDLVGCDDAVFDECELMEGLLVQDFPHDVIIIDSGTMVLNGYGLTKSKKTLETIKKVFRGKKVYIIAHTNKKVPPVLETGFERYVMGGQFLFQQATAVFLLVFKDNRRYLKVLKANRNSYDMYRGDLGLL